jgi:hypothetical protein
VARPRLKAAQRKAAALEDQLTPARRAREVGQMFEEAARRVLRTQARRQFAGGAPLWVYTAIDLLSVYGAEAVCRTKGFRPDAMPRVAAYIGSGLWDVYSRAITEFDPDHMAAMEAADVSDGGDDDAAVHDGVAEGERDAAGGGGDEAAREGGDDAVGGGAGAP